MTPETSLGNSTVVPRSWSEATDEVMAQEWVPAAFGKGEIDRAGRAAAEWWTTPQQPGTGLGHSFVVIDNWRTSHSMPLLVFRMGLTKRAQRIDHEVIVAQRLKRFSSIMNKLAREKNMKLSQMQDLGGCRAILSDVESVDRLFDIYRGPSDLFGYASGIKCYDYIRNPKPDGYRGIHIVGRYVASLHKNELWNGHRIEIQLRSQLQHAFATAVETVTTFTQQPLKFGAGPLEWRRFFSLMGTALAMREQTAPVDGTPTNRKELITELREATKALKVYQRLKGWADALEKLPRRNIRGFKWLLLVLNINEATIKVTGFKDREKADRAVAQIERMKRADLDAVLVWVNSAQELRAAYPNYYADTGKFLSALSQALRA